MKEVQAQIWNSWDQAILKAFPGTIQRLKHSKEVMTTLSIDSDLDAKTTFGGYVKNSLFIV